MKIIVILTWRNIKIYFKDNSLLFSSFISPIILLFLYILFLYRIFHESFDTLIKSNNTLEPIVDGICSGQVISSLLAVIVITIPFTIANVMVLDKSAGVTKDFFLTPVKKITLALSYFLATYISSLIICLTTMILGLVYIYKMGWYLTSSDILGLTVDTVLLTLLGTTLSVLINSFLSSMQQVSIWGTIIGAGYGFFCGAYMPIHSFPQGVQNITLFNPATYGTSNLRIHAMESAFNKLADKHVPKEAIKEMEEALDMIPNFFGHTFNQTQHYLIVLGGIIILTLAYFFVFSQQNRPQK